MVCLLLVRKGTPVLVVMGEMTAVTLARSQDVPQRRCCKNLLVICQLFTWLCQSRYSGAIILYNPFFQKLDVKC